MLNSHIGLVGTVPDTRRHSHHPRRVRGQCSSGSWRTARREGARGHIWSVHSRPAPSGPEGSTSPEEHTTQRLLGSKLSVMISCIWAPFLGMLFLVSNKLMWKKSRLLEVYGLEKTRIHPKMEQVYQQWPFHRAIKSALLSTPFCGFRVGDTFKV